MSKRSRGRAFRRCAKTRSVPPPAISAMTISNRCCSTLSEFIGFSFLIRSCFCSLLFKRFACCVPNGLVPLERKILLIHPRRPPPPGLWRTLKAVPLSSVVHLLPSPFFVCSAPFVVFSSFFICAIRVPRHASGSSTSVVNSLSSHHSDAKSF